jgi:ankyrin repeat protein
LPSTLCVPRHVFLGHFLLAACALMFIGASPPDGDVDILQFHIRDPRLKADQMFSDPKVVALAVAAENGNVKAIDAMLEQGVNVDAVGKHAITPLAWTLITKNKAGFKRLLQHGANPNFYVWNQVPLIHLAAEQQDTDWLRLCLQYRGDPNVVNRCKGIPDGEQTTIFAALHSSTFEQKLDMLVKAGANLNHQADAGYTPLLEASMFGAFSRVHLLLEAGADFHIPMKGGRDLAFDMIWELPRLTDPADEESRADRDMVLDFLEAHGADFGPAEADIRKNFPKIVPLWEQDKKRRAARTKEAMAAKLAPRDPSGNTQSAESSDNWIVPDSIGTVILLQPRPSPYPSGKGSHGERPLQSFINALTPPSNDVASSSPAPPIEPSNVGYQPEQRHPGGCVANCGRWERHYRKRCRIHWRRWH